MYIRFECEVELDVFDWSREERLPIESQVGRVRHRRHRRLDELPLVVQPLHGRHAAVRYPVDDPPQILRGARRPAHELARARVKRRRVTHEEDVAAYSNKK